MGLLSWVLIPPAIAAMLAAKYHEAGLSVAHQCALVSMCLLALLLYQGSTSFGFGWHPGRRSSIKYGGSTRIDVPFRQVNNSLYELHRPEGTPGMQVVFFHGLRLVDVPSAHVWTWTSEDGSLIWPREWLVEDFPRAHIFTVSYSEGVRDLDLFLVGENLTSDLIHSEIGQVPLCPVILVGYCVGGLVIKQICLQAKYKLDAGKTPTIDREKLGMFLDNVRGVFYYGTPHHGSSLIANVPDGPFFRYFKVLNKEAARLNSQFDDLRVSYPTWKVYGLGESLATKSGLFQGHVVVPEGASREGDKFNVVEADHNMICQPRNKVDRRFYALRNLINSIITDMEEETRVREETSVEGENFQTLPEEIVGMDARVLAVECILNNTRKLGIAGMGGVGKTTLAKALFNTWSSWFEYTCFVPNMKLIDGTKADAKKAVWAHMHHHGKTVEGDKTWSSLRDKELLLVLDDICLRDEEVLLDIARDSARDSRFIATSRNQDLLSSLDEVFVVPFLENKDAEVLFAMFAFPNQANPPSELETVMKDIIKKCDGLPLTLIVLGTYLKRKRDYEQWEQTLTALKKAEEISNFNERLWEQLRPSYNDLNEKEQQIFLDATTFFSRNVWTLGEAKAAWRAAYDASETLLWQTLVDRSLVYSVNDDEPIEVHEQLQSLGQKIASEPSNLHKGRVWDGKLGLKMLRTTAEELDIKGIHALVAGDPRDRERILIPTNTVSKLKEVRFLTLENIVTIDEAEDGASVPTEVVLLKCVGQGLFNPALQTRLAVLVLEKIYYLPPSIGQLSGLKILNIEYLDGRTLPDSFGQLKALQYLTLSHAWELQSLPESFGQLSALKYLEINYCSLQTLPESFGQLKALQRLYLFSCAQLQSLPESFGELDALKAFDFLPLSDVLALPESFGKLPTLTVLVLECDYFCYLPDSFGQLKKLQRLSIDAEIVRWPDSAKDLGLIDLEISYYSPANIPDWIKSLPSLRRLKLVAFINLANPLPPWLITPNGPSNISKDSRMVFQVQDGCFSLMEEDRSFEELMMYMQSEAD